MKDTVWSRLQHAVLEDLAFEAGTAHPEGMHALGKLAMALGRLTPEQHASCLQELEKSEHVTLAEILVRRGHITSKEIVDLLRLRGGTSAPNTLGRYVIVRELGRGAMGTVYQALQPGLERAVALKVMIAHPELSTEDIARFHREARIAGQLRHPNIVGVHDAGNDGDRHYIAMDFIDGPTLGSWMEDRNIPVRAKIETLAKVADALQFAHAGGVIHRDLKPTNILLDAAGEPHLVDFGLARSSAILATMTQTGTVMGTPAYMSPEQVQGKSKDVSPRSDLYSLGVILYEMLTGRLPFEGSTVVDLFDRILKSEARAPSKVRPGVDRDLETICMKAMDKESRRRYATAGEFAADLRRWLAGEPVQGRPISLFTKASRRFRRNAPAWTLAAVGLVAIVTVTILATRSAGQKQQAFDIVSAYSELDRSFEPILARAEDLRCLAKPDSAARAAILRDAEALLTRLEERYPGIGVPSHFKAYLTNLLDGGTGEIHRAIEKYPEEPFGRLLRARLHLRKYFESLPSPEMTFAWSETMAAITTWTPPAEPESSRRFLRQAVADLKAIRALPGWNRFGSLQWLSREIEAMEAIHDRKFDDALGRLRSLSRESVGRADLVLAIAQLEFLQYHYPQTLEAVRPLMALRPGLVPAFYWAGMAHLGEALKLQMQQMSPLPELEPAIAEFDRAAKGNPNWLSLAMDRGYAHLFAATWRKAHGADPLPDFRSAVESFAADPGRPQDKILATWLLLRTRLNRGEDAWAEADRLIEALIAPDAPATVATHRFRPVIVSEYARLAVERGADPRKALDQALKDFDAAPALEAIELFHKATIHSSVAFLPGLSPEEMNRSLQACGEACWQAVLKDGNLIEAHVLRIDVLLEHALQFANPTGELEKLVVVCDRLLAKRPGHPQLLACRGRVQRRLADAWLVTKRAASQERYRLAIKDLEDAIAALPGHVPNHTELAACHARLSCALKGGEAVRELELAIEASNRARKLAPALPGVLTERAGEWYLLGNVGGSTEVSPEECWKRAVADATEAIRMSPRQFGAFLFRAGAKEKLGDVEGAAADARKFLEYSPNHAEALEMLRRVEKGSPR